MRGIEDICSDAFFETVLASFLKNDFGDIVASKNNKHIASYVEKNQLVCMFNGRISQRELKHRKGGLLEEEEVD